MREKMRNYIKECIEVITWEKWLYNYKKYKREFWIVFSIFVLFGIFIKCHTFSKTDIFEEAIEEYQNNTGIKIYPYGKDCLRKATKDCKTKEEIYNVIVSNEKWFK